jgi:hypothetical protein
MVKKAEADMEAPHRKPDVQNIKKFLTVIFIQVVKFGHSTIFGESHPYVLS